MNARPNILHGLQEDHGGVLGTRLSAGVCDVPVALAPNGGAVMVRQSDAALVSGRGPGVVRVHGRVPEGHRGLVLNPGNNTMVPLFARSGG